MAGVQVLLTAGLDVPKSIKEINNTINHINKNPSMQRIKLMVDTDVSAASKNLEKFTDIASEAFTSSFLDSLKSTNEETAQLGTNMGTASTRIAAATGSTRALTIGVASLGVAFRAALSATIIGAAFALVSFGIEKLIGHFANLKARIKEATEINYDQINSLIEEKKSLQGLIVEYEKLNLAERSGVATSTEKQQLLEIQTELAEKYGVTATGINAENKAYADNKYLMKSRLDAIQAEIDAENELNLMKLRSKDSESNENISSSQRSINKLGGKHKKQENVIRKLKESQASGEITVDGMGRELISEKLEFELQNLLVLQVDLESAKSTLSGYISERSKIIETEAIQYISNLEQNGKQISDREKAFIVEISSTIASSGDSIDDQIININGMVDKLDSSKFDQKLAEFEEARNLGNQSRMGEIKNDTVALLDTLTEGVDNADVFKTKILTWFSDTGQPSSIARFTLDMAKFKDTVATATNELVPLNQAIYDVTNGQALSSDTVTDLVMKYPELASAVSNTAGVYSIEASALEGVRSVRELNHIQALDSETSITNSAVLSLNERLKTYGIEVQSIKSLSDARVKAMSISAYIPPPDILSKLPQETQSYFKAEQIRIDALKNDVISFGELIEQVNFSKSQLANRDRGVTKITKSSTPSTPSQSPVPNGLSDLNFQNELIESFKTEYNERQKNIGLIEKQIKNTERQKDSVKLIELENQKLNEQNQSIKDLIVVQNKLKEEADKVRNNGANKGLNIDSFFDSNGNTSKKYIDLMESFETNSNKILKNNKLSNAEKEKGIKKLEAERDHIQSVFQEVQTYKKGWIDVRNLIGGHKEAIDLSKSALEDLNQEIYDNAVKANKEWKDNVNDIADQVIDTYKDAIDAQMKAEDNRHELFMDAKDEEIRKHEEAVNAILQANDRLESTDSYNSDLSGKQKEQSKLKSQIDELALDDSMEANATRRGLEEQLAEKTIEIEKFKKERQSELVKQSLLDNIENKKKEVDEEIRLEDEKYEASKEILQNQLNDEATFAKIRQDILDGNIEGITASLTGFATDISSKMGLIGQSITTNVLDKIGQIPTLLKSINYEDSARTTPEPLPSQNIPTGNANGRNYIPANVAERLAIGAMKENSEKWGSVKGIERVVLEVANRKLGKEIGASYNSSEGKWYKDKLPLYHEGGIVGGRSNRLSRIINQIFNVKPNEVVAKLLNDGSEVVVNTDRLQRNLPQVSDTSSPGDNQFAATDSNVLNIGTLMHVDKIEKDVDLDKLFQQIENRMKGYRVSFTR